MTQLIDLTNAHLTTVARENRFELLAGEPLPVGLKRLGLGELETAISWFYDGEEGFGKAVHEARKSMKRLRAILRLVRFELGERIYRFENLTLRDAARLISEVRSSAVRAATVSLMRKDYGQLLAPGVFEELEERLSTRARMIEQRTMEDSEIVPRVVSTLERARARYGAWPTDPDARTVYGFGIRGSFAALAPGLRQTYLRGRLEMQHARTTPTAANLHQWRKRAKYLRHQMEMLTPLWPEVVGGYATTFDRLGEVLGEDHDLAEVLRLVSARPELCPDPAERSLFAALAQRRRSELQNLAWALGRRVFADKPGAFTARFGEYWESQDLERVKDTIVVY